MHLSLLHPPQITRADTEIAAVVSTTSQVAPRVSPVAPTKLHFEKRRQYKGDDNSGEHGLQAGGSQSKPSNNSKYNNG